MTISQLAKKAGVIVETVRFYERKGLIPEPPRLKSGYRQYSDDDVVRIKFIKRAQELGFSLKEIAELLSLRVDPDTTCADVKKQAELKIVDIEGKINSLQKMKQALKKLSASCSEANTTTECPILDYLEFKVTQLTKVAQ